METVVGVLGPDRPKPQSTEEMSVGGGLKR